MRFVTRLMIEWISKFRGVSPHHSWNFLLPKRSMIAAQQNGKIFLQAEGHAQTDDRQSGQISAGARKRCVQDIIRVSIGEQTEKIAGIGDTDWEAGRDSLGFWQVGSKSDHLEYVRAFDFDCRLCIQPANEIAAAEQVVFFAIERDEAHRRSRFPA